MSQRMKSVESWEELQRGSRDGVQGPTSGMGCQGWGWLTLPMALAQACSVSGPSVPSCCTFSPVRKSSRVKRNLQRMNQPVSTVLYPEPTPRARPDHYTKQGAMPSLPSVCPWALWASHEGKVGGTFLWGQGW